MGASYYKAYPINTVETRAGDFRAWENSTNKKANLKESQFGKQMKRKKRRNFFEKMKLHR